MRRNSPFPRAAGEALLAFLKSRRGESEWPEPPQEAFQPVQSPLSIANDNWFSWDSMMGAILGSFTANDETRVHNPEREIPEIAHCVVENVGLLTAKEGQPTDTASCVERGEAYMQRTVKEHARWLYGMHAKEPRSVMYVTHPAAPPDGAPATRVAVLVTLPLKKAAFADFANGVRNDKELTPDDLTSPSKYLFINALFPILRANPGILHSRDARLAEPDQTAAEVNCLFYQYCYLTRKPLLGRRPRRPVVVTISTMPHFYERLVRHGFIDTKVKMRGFEVPIMMFRHPVGVVENLSPKRLGFYGLFLMMLFLYRFANKKEWAEDDESRLELQR